jgi:hypothetical protein
VDLAGDGQGLGPYRPLRAKPEPITPGTGSFIIAELIVDVELPKINPV